jgi:hypothetical protein
MIWIFSLALAGSFIEHAFSIIHGPNIYWDVMQPLEQATKEKLSQFCHVPVSFQTLYMEYVTSMLVGILYLSLSIEWIQINVV